MEPQDEYMPQVMLIAIVNSGSGSRAGALAVAGGAKGCTILLGRGTAPGKILSLFGLESTPKEIVITVIPARLSDAIIDAWNSDFGLARAGSGIAFAVPVRELHGTSGYQLSAAQDAGERSKMDKTSHDVIFTIIDRGEAEDVVEASREAGAEGGTIIKGRGSGIHETQKFFGISIEPEKEMIITLIPKARTNAVLRAIERKLGLSRPGRGMAFVMDVSRTAGIAHLIEKQRKAK